MEIKNPLVTKRLLFRLVFHVVYVIGSTTFTVGFGTALQSMNSGMLWQMVFPVLAVFYGFSALLYNRSRALSPGKEQRRSLYAAERSLQATVLYLVGLAFTFGTHQIFFFLGRKPQSANSPIPNDQFFVATPSIVLIGFSWVCFYFALRAISHTVFHWQRPKKILRRLK